MSRKIISDDKKAFWHLLLRVSGGVKERIEKQADREGRSASYLISRLLERYYENEKQES